MTIIGLTGRAGSGKTEAEKVISAHFSCWLLDLDKVGHEVLKDPFVKERLVTSFGASILENHAINRKVLGEIVFSDSNKLKQLNVIVHPFIKIKVSEFIEAHKGQDGVISGALLEEIGLLPYCKSVITIDSEDEAIQKISPRQFSIAKHQKDRSHYRALANIVVYNCYTEQFYDSLREALKKCFGT